MAKGSKCCALKTEKVDKVSLCDGGNIKFTSSSNCCRNHAYKPCKDPPCTDYKPCFITEISAEDSYLGGAPRIAGTEVIGIVSTGSCTGKGEADFSISYAKQIEEKFELNVSMTYSYDVDWNISQKFNLGRIAEYPIWSFGTEINRTWTSVQGGKRSVSDTRTKYTDESILSSARSSSASKKPGVGLLVATANKYMINIRNLPVKVSTQCHNSDNAPKATHCIYDGKDYLGPTIRKVYDNYPVNYWKQCMDACAVEPECYAATYAEYNYWFKRSSACWLKRYKKGAGFGGNRWPHFLTKSATMYQCGEEVEAKNVPYRKEKWSNTIDFQSLKYGEIRFVPINTATCLSDLINCIKNIPVQWKSDPDRPNNANLDRKIQSCVDKHGKGAV